MAESAGKKTGKALASAAGSALEWMDNAGDFVWDGMKELGRSAAVGAIDLADTVEEVPKFVVDLGTNALTGGKGTNWGEGDSWADKQFKEAKETIKSADVSDSKWSETPAGKAALKVAGFVGEEAPTAVLGAGAWKLGKAGLKIAPKLFQKFSKVPGATEDLKKLVAMGNKVEQSHLDDFMAKYGEKVASKAKASVDETHLMQKKLAKMFEGKTEKEIVEMAKKDGRIKKAWDWMMANKGTTGSVLGGAATVGLASSALSEDEAKTESAVSADTRSENRSVANQSDTKPQTERKTEAVQKEEQKRQTQAPSIGELKAKNPKLNVSTSIADYMRARGLDGSKAGRAKMAEDLGIKGYVGTKEQNMEMFKKIQNLPKETIEDYMSR